MIGSSSEVGRILHQEHLDTLAAMNTLEEIIDSRFRDRPPDVSREAVRQQLGTLITAVDHDLCSDLGAIATCPPLAADGAFG